MTLGAYFTSFLQSILKKPSFSPIVSNFAKVFSLPFFSLRLKILIPALKEINEITDLNVQCEIADKDRKKVTKLRFEFTKKDKDLLDFIQG